MCKNKIKTLLAGVAKCDITTSKPETPVMDPLYAKALVLDDGNTKLVIITMDVTAIGGRRISDGMLNDVGEDFLPELRSRVQEKLHIPGLNVLVNASHTHPPGRLLCDDDEQIDRVYDAVSRAMQNMTEVKIGIGSGSENRVTMNRTLNLKNGKQWSIRHTNPSPPDEEVESAGPIDPEIGILRIDRIDGSPLAVVYNFACHLLFGDAHGSITGNIPAYASKLIEETLGHDSMAFFIQGAAGDVIDVNFKDFSRSRDIKSLGFMLGESTLKAYKNIQPKEAELKILSETITVPRRTDIPEKIALLQKERVELLESLHGTTLNFKSFLPLYQADLKIDSGMDALNKHNIDKYLKNICSMEKLARIQDKITTLEKHQRINEKNGEKTIDMELQAIKIGDCVIVSSSAELLTEIGLNIKKASPYKHTFVAAYSNGYIHYGAPAADYDKGGYEVTECLLAPEWQEIFETKTQKLINKLRK
jgi:hypothetical protein